MMDLEGGAPGGWEESVESKAKRERLAVKRVEERLL